MESLLYPAGVSPDSVLSRYELFKTRDIDEARQWGERVFCENRLRQNGTARALNARMYYRRLRGLGMGRLSYGCDVTIAPGTLDSFYLVQMPICGRESIDVGGQEVCSTPRTGTVLDARRTVVIRHADDTEKLILRVDRDALERHCQQHLGHGLRGPIEFQTKMPLDTTNGRRWMGLMRWLCDTLSTEEEALPPLIAAQAENMVINTLLGSHAHNYSEELAGEDRSIAPAFVKRIEHYIDEHAHEPITIIELAEHAGVSSRSIFNGFRRFRNTSPMLYLKEVRLRRVNEELSRAAPGEATVTAVAYKWGFGHLGHFTTDYKRRFGESPSETLAR